ncbi:LOG family protein [Corynebacterium poyangense]|uniref:LOG family protein n=1 Tax=Corynebacterium poyangense TaxID=2684405 RepID=UPI001CCA3FF6|nr:TIGR00730 family Rossman fold protein [Corynebacterium poyangense]
MNSAPTKPIRRVAVYCGSAHGHDPAFVEAARDTGTELARRGITLVYGGGNIGLMGVVADATLAAGGEVIGVIPTQLVNREMAHRGIQVLETVDTMAQRKARMEELADAFVVLPGGLGTLEELGQVLTGQLLGFGYGPVGLINTHDYWQPLVSQLETMVHSGFLPSRYLTSLVVNPRPVDVLDAFSSWNNPGAKWDQ